MLPTKILFFVDKQAFDRKKEKSFHISTPMCGLVTFHSISVVEKNIVQISDEK